MSEIKAISVKLRSGLLLSLEILQQFQHQRSLYELQYSVYPDGIIYGFEPIDKDGKLFLTPGLIKHFGSYFYCEKPIDVSAYMDCYDKAHSEELTCSTHMALVLSSEGNTEISEGLWEESLGLNMTTGTEEDSIVLAEFLYHQGCRQWQSQSKARDQLNEQLSSNGYYWSFVNVKYSMPNENVFSPIVCTLMRKCLEDLENKAIADWGLLFTLSQNRTVSNNVLFNWLKTYDYDIDMSKRADVIDCFINCVETVRDNNPPKAPCDTDISSNPPKKERTKMCMS